MTSKSARKQQKIDFMIKLSVVCLNPLFTLAIGFVSSPYSNLKTDCNTVSDAVLTRKM